MRARLWLLLVPLLHAGLATPALAQQGIRWQPNLETAKRIAAQTNRLVLVHFWIDPCQPCKRMEEEVFSRDDVANAVAENYVAVQVNGKYLPKTAREFGVTRFPSDVIITPGGDVVERSVGAMPAAQYVDRLDRIAAYVLAQPPADTPQPPGNYGRAPATYAQAPNDPSRMGAYPGGADPGRMPYSGVEGPYRPTGGERPRPQDYASDGPQGYSTPPWGSDYEPPRASSPSVSAGATGWDVAQGARSRRQEPGGAFANNTPASYQGPGGQPQDSPPPADQGRSDPRAPWGPAASGPPADRAGAVAQRPAEPPPLGLEGFCPVQLTEGNRWVRGTHEAGVIHRGRLYLCAGPEERRKFLADPERYAPILGGFDVVVAVEQNQLVAGFRKYGLRYDRDGRIYLFASQAARERFAQDPARYAAAVARAMAAASQRAAAARQDRFGRPAESQPVGRY